MIDTASIWRGVGALRAELETLGCDCRTWDDLFEENRALLAENNALRALAEAAREWARRLSHPEMGTGTTELLAALDALDALRKEDGP